MWVVLGLEALKEENLFLAKSKADVTIISGARSNEQRIGGLVGRLENNARITKSYVTGKYIIQPLTVKSVEWSARTTLMV